MSKLNLGQYGKLFTAVAGLAITLLTQKYASTSGAQDWLPYVVGVASALGVYGVPNTPKMLTVTGEVAQTLAPVQLAKTTEPLYGDTVATGGLQTKTPASQAGSPTAATEGMPKVT